MCSGSTDRQARGGGVTHGQPATAALRNTVARQEKRRRPVRGVLITESVHVFRADSWRYHVPRIPQPLLPIVQKQTEGVVGHNSKSTTTRHDLHAQKRPWKWPLNTLTVTSRTGGQHRDYTARKHGLGNHNNYRTVLQGHSEPLDVCRHSAVTYRWHTTAAASSPIDCFGIWSRHMCRFFTNMRGARRSIKIFGLIERHLSRLRCTMRDKSGKCQLLKATKESRVFKPR